MKDFPYDNIVHLSEPELIRPRMSRSRRAAQFKPFAALQGFEEMIAESSREKKEKKELSEAEREELDEKLQFLHHHPDKSPALTVVFETDEGEKQIRGTLVKLDLSMGMMKVGAQRIVIRTIRKIEIMENLDSSYTKNG